MLKKLLIAVLLLLLAAFAYLQLVFVPNTDARMNPVADLGPYAVSEEAQALHDTLYVADLHADSLMWRRNTTRRNDRGHVDLPRLREGGVDFQVFSTVTKSPRGLNFAENAADAPDDITLVAVAQLWPPRTWQSIYERAAYQAQRLNRYAEDPENGLVVARWKSDLTTDHPDGTVLGLLLSEGAHPLEGDVANVQRLFDEGYRAMGLQHFFDNELGGSLHGQTGAGLTEFGYAAVREMWKLNIAVDLAHASEAVSRNVLDMPERGPVFISHGGVRDTCLASQQRNLPDDLLRRIADRGGILGIGYFEGAICNIRPEGIADAIVKAVDLLGVDAVALGSDYDGTVTVPFDTSQLAVITHQLMERGLSDADIRAIMGENVRRFFIDSLPISPDPDRAAETLATLEAQRRQDEYVTLATDVMRTLSDDSFEGRQWGTPGNERARSWIKSRIAELETGARVEEQSFSRTVTRRAQTRDVTGTNIIATLPGQAPDGPILELTAHFDHIGVRDDGDVFNGADDNASGVGALFALLSHFRDNPPDHEVRFVFLDTEEVGLAGAWEYAAERLDDRPRVNLNFDMIAQNADGEIYASGTSHYPELRPVVEAAAANLPITVRFGHDRPEDGPNDWSMSSDHAAFHARGIPFVYFGVVDHEHYHQVTDEFDTIPLPTYHAVVRLILNAAETIDARMDILARAPQPVGPSTDP